MIHIFHSDMVGAPVLSGVAGSLVAVLDACLVDGWGATAVDNLVISGGVATVTRAGHAMTPGAVAEIANATTSGGSVNGNQKVLSASSSTYTFATGLPDQTATGSITHKLAPAGWQKAFGGATVGAYLSLDTAGTQRYLRVDDTGTTNARVVGYETMTDQDTGTGPFPTPVQLSGGAHWPKSYTASAVARGWTLIADSRAFYLLLKYYDVVTYAVVVSFGDFASNKAADAHACLLTGSQVDISANTPNAAGAMYADLSYGAASQGSWASRGVSGVGSSQPIFRVGGMSGTSGVTSFLSGASALLMAYPNPANNGLYLAPFNLMEGAGTVCFRGVLAGAYFCPMNLGASAFATGSEITGVSGLDGKTLTALNTGAGAIFVDLTGPWAR